MLAPHAPGVGERWCDGGVEVRTFRYAPARWEVLGYGRSLKSDESLRPGALAVTPLYLLGALGAVRRELAARRYDLLHCHWLVPNGLVAIPLAGRLPIALGVHGSDVFLAESRGLAPLARWVLSCTRLLTGCSPELVARTAALGFDPRRARVIPYGVDADLFSPAGERRSIWRQRLGIPDRATVVLAVGRMVSKKGFHILLEVLPQLLDRQAQVHVILAGEGDRLEEFRAGAAHLGRRVHFPGLVLRDALPDLYRAADLFVLAAVHDARGNVDGLPNVILEAMASGLPVVATRLSGIPLAVAEGETGLLVPEGHREALFAALNRLVRDPVLRVAMARAGRRRVERELTWPAVAERYRQAYREVLG